MVQSSPTPWKQKIQPRKFRICVVFFIWWSTMRLIINDLLIYQLSTVCNSSVVRLIIMQFPSVSSRHFCLFMFLRCLGRCITYLAWAHSITPCSFNSRLYKLFYHCSMMLYVALCCFHLLSSQKYFVTLGISNPVENSCFT